MKKKYKALFFDLDNTLWDFDKNSYKALKATYFSFNLNTDNIDFEIFFKTYLGFNEKFWDDYRKKLISKQELIKKRFEQTFMEFNIRNIDPVQFNDYYLNVMPEQNTLVEGTMEVLEYLRTKHYTLYIITNGFLEVQNRKLISSGLKPFFRNIYISEILKAPKPAKEIFEYAIKSSNARKRDSLMIGDSWDVDIVGALNAGIDQVYFKNQGLPDLNEEELVVTKNSKTSTFCINSLIQLKNIL